MNSNGKIARKKGSYLYWFLVIWILLFVKSFIFWPTLDTLKRFLSTGSFMFSTKFQFFLFFIRFFYYKNQITTGTTKQHFPLWCKYSYRKYSKSTKTTFFRQILIILMRLTPSVIFLLTIRIYWTPVIAERRYFKEFNPIEFYSFKRSQNIVSNLKKTAL